MPSENGEKSSHETTTYGFDRSTGEAEDTKGLYRLGPALAS